MSAMSWARGPRFPAPNRLLALVALALAGCGKEAPPPAARAPVPVGTVTVAAQSAPVTPEFVGLTESSQQVEIRSRVSGFLDKRVYTEGQVVKAGQLLFVMDKKPFEAQLQAAKAELAAQQARLTVARQNLARVQPLAAQNALSKKDNDDSVGQEQTAAAAVEAARAKVVDAELNLGYCTITSPVAGATSYAKQQDGSYVSPENSLLTYVAKLDPMRVNFSLSENEMLRIRGEKASGALDLPPQDNFEVEVVLADGSKFPGKGRLTFTDASFSQETGTFLLRAELPNPQGTLRPGQFVRVRLIGAKRPGSFVIPQRAVQQGPRGEFVWLVDKDGKAEQRVIEVGDWIGDDWLIRKGLRPGERLIVDGALKLAPGVPVKATDIAAGGKAASGAVGASGAGFAPAGTARTTAAAGGGAGGGAYAATAPAAAGSGPAGMRTEPADPEDAVNRPSVAVYFETGSAVMRNDAVQQLRSLAQWLAANPQRGVTLSGYADKRGSAGANAALAKQRAQNVRGALLVAGADEAQVELQAPRGITGGSDDTLARRVDVMPRGAAKP